MKSIHYGFTHYLAQCQDCEIDFGLNTDGKPAEIRRKIKNHIDKTGHTMILEYSGSIHYKN